jgi:hypothetical protein
MVGVALPLGIKFEANFWTKAVVENLRLRLSPSGKWMKTASAVKKTPENEFGAFLCSAKRGKLITLAISGKKIRTAF